MSRIYIAALFFALGNSAVSHPVERVHDVDIDDRFVWSSEGGRHAWFVWAAEGEELVIPCHIGTQGNNAVWINVGWQKDNQTLVVDERLSITTGGNLNISKVVHRSDGDSDVGYYHCLVRLPEGVVISPSIRLLMARMNKNISISSSHGSVVEGRYVRLSCNVISSPAANITWLHNNSVIDNSHRFSTTQAGVLKISPVQLSDAGSYRCLASNSLLGVQSEQSEVMLLDVVPRCNSEAHVPPHFLIDSQLQGKKVVRGVEGQQIVVDCLASGWPLPQIQWFNGSNWHDWEELTPTNMINITNGTLVIDNIHHSDSMTYRCTATNTNPYTQRKYSIKQDTVLDVMKPPKITRTPQRISTHLAKTTRLNCLTRGHPQPQITWYKQGLLVNLTVDFHQRQDGQLINTFPMPSDSGLYQCLARNDAGYDTHWAYLSVESPGNLPDPPTQLSISDITPYGVVVTWSPVPPKPGQSPVIGYSLKYNALGNVGMSIFELSASTNVTLDNLLPNTEYVVRIHSFSTYLSEPSQQLQFRTPDAVPSTAPSFDLKTTSNSSIMVHWEELPKDKANGEIVGHNIYCWRKRRQPILINYVPVSEDFFEIKDLRPGKKYHLLVLAGTSAGFPDPEDFEDSWATFQLPKKFNILNVSTTQAPENTTSEILSSKAAMNEDEGNQIKRYEVSICHSASTLELNETSDLEIPILSDISINMLNDSDGTLSNEIQSRVFNAKEVLKAVQTKITVLQTHLDGLMALHVDAEFEFRRAQDKLNDAKAALRSASRRLSQTLTKVSNAETLLHIAKAEMNTAELKINMAEAEFNDTAENELLRLEYPRNS